MLNNTRIVIFDFDGTLGDTRKIIINTMQATIKELGLPANPSKTYKGERWSSFPEFCGNEKKPCYTYEEAQKIVMNNGINIICNLVDNKKIDTNLFSKNIILILSELVESSDFCREKLKQSKTLDLIGKMLISCKKTNKKTNNNEKIKIIIQIILSWMREDKNFVEEFIIKDEIFLSLFENLNSYLGDNISEYLTILNDLLNSDEFVEKFFTCDNLVKNVIELLGKTNMHNFFY